MLIEGGQRFPFFFDLFGTIYPDVIALQTQNSESGHEHCPEIFRERSGEMVKKVKTGQIARVTHATGLARTAHHPSQNEDDGGKDVEDQQGADQVYRRRMTEYSPDGFIQGEKKGKAVQGPDTEEDKEGKGQQFNRKLVLQLADIAYCFLAKPLTVFFPVGCGCCRRQALIPLFPFL